MAIISSYPYDILVRDNDAWIGTDSATRRTKQYTAESIANYLNTQGKISVGGKMVYKFVEVPYSEQGTFSMPSGGGNGTAFSAVNSLKMNYREKSGQDVVAFVEYIVNRDILISSQSAISEFGHYKVVQFTEDPDPIHQGWYNLTLEYIGGNGSLSINDSYDLVLFAGGEGLADKTFTWEQGTPASVWTIQHDLEKMPSVSLVVGDDQTQVFGQVDYIDNNNLTITLGGPASGYAYLN